MNKQYGSVAMAGADVHYKFSRVTFRDAKGRIVTRERLDHADREALSRRLSQWPKGLEVVLEASFGWAWLADLMLELGLRPRLSNCWKLEQMRRARGWPKTNKKDADLLSLLGLEGTNWWEVWLAPPEVRDRREWMRYRADLVGLQTQTKNRIHAVFHRHGIFYEEANLFRGPGRQFLVALCREGHDRLRPGALAALRGHVRLLDHVRQALAAVTRKLRKELTSTPLVERFTSIPGFGLILSHVLVAEIGRIERFGSQKKLASYSLLSPQVADSGEEDSSRVPKGRHLGRRGNRTLKWTLIEAAHGAVRRGARWRRMFDRYTDGGRTNRNRGYIKVARELVKVVYAIWKNGTRYTERGLDRPGRRERLEKQLEQSSQLDSRSGTGQLCHAMVAAE